VNPYVEPALISAGALILSGGWTALAVAITARVTRETSKEAIDAATENVLRSQDAAREQRIWDKQAATYVDTFSYMRWRLRRRQSFLKQVAGGVRPEEEKVPEVFSDMYSRMYAYASTAVRAAYTAAHDADAKAADLYREWSSMAGQDKEAAAEAVRAAAKAATAKDDKLAAAIRADLQRGQAEAFSRMALPGPPPIEHA
jgi:hypothetical protein